MYFTYTSIYGGEENYGDDPAAEYTYDDDKVRSCDVGVCSYSLIHDILVKTFQLGSAS